MEKDKLIKMLIGFLPLLLLFLDPPEGMGSQGLGIIPVLCRRYFDGHASPGR